MNFFAEHHAEIRQNFPGLARRVGDRPAAFLDGPAGTQVPRQVLDAVGHTLAHVNANHGGCFATSVETDCLMAAARSAAADFFQASDPDEIVFGPNMTTLTLGLSRALARTWHPGDEIIVTRLDHDANVSPWVRAARDAGASVRFIDFEPATCRWQADAIARAIEPRTVLVALGCASNATGGINPWEPVVAAARRVGALVFLDAVHYAPHAAIDVAAWDADFVACSAYKFFGPHAGILWGRRTWLESLPAYKVRPADERIPDRWMTGTAAFELIAGTAAAIEYLAELGRAIAGQPHLPRRAALERYYAELAAYERGLARRFLLGVAAIPSLRIFGDSDPDHLERRFATFSLRDARIPSSTIVQQLAAAGVFAWQGHFYALEFTESLGLEPDGVVRVGFVQYNSADDVDRAVEALAAIANGRGRGSEP